ncbi:RnfABCDGE type electron transport complex subunit D [Aquibacillus sp. 3ASR75-11]|uniref:RnfABCDGE type electron transport complex subunit D n=1 Tax=Terrihalobacillus insolitus TaxID=2950438 RepID=A0A9X4AMN4_9BACI|nr:RnfABCDGE type electron transport complex subunit D [Terrihalobacillus insolitus]MDC3414797.1 RnfABCDGE type electron transport complex subunit D [Terrihalobacillus insolitus]MDC3425632.1 RnfABCDGE type electron transport complex subunit D [Terrihalobacillus insolitus]
MIKIRDPRIAQILVLTGFTVLGLVYLQFRVTLIQVIVTLVVCMLLEVGIIYAKEAKLIFPKSSIITALSIALLLRADTVTPFLMASIIAIGSKHWIRYDGNHIFNPSNIGIVVVALLYPITVATAPLQWGFIWALLFVIITAGIYMVYKVSRFPVIASFLSAFLLGGLVRMLIWDKTFQAIFNEFMWGGLLIFTFFMITDPKTSPNSKKGQIFFGSVVAILGQVMIQLEVHSALFISLAVVCLVRVLWRIGESTKLLPKNRNRSVVT